MIRDEKIQKILDEIVEKPKTEYQPEKIILYGSYAYGEPDEDSDIDLFIVKETPVERIYRFAEVKRLVYKPERGIPVSPLVYTPGEVDKRLAIGDQFVGEILSKGITLYAR